MPAKVAAFDADFEESKHPRDKSGKFGSGGAKSSSIGGNKNKDPLLTKNSDGTATYAGIHENEFANWAESP